MYCVTIQEGNEDDRFLYYYDRTKAITKIKILLQDEINYYVDGVDEKIDFCFLYTSHNQMQSILNTIIKQSYGERQDDYKYHVFFNEITFEDEDVC
jgi:hypothetical protein